MSEETSARDTQRTLDEHHHLRHFVAELGSCLEEPPHDPSLAERFGELRHLLESHFEFEEQGGYFEGVLTEAPWLEREVRTLRRQHARFLLQLLEMEKMVTPNRWPLTWRELRAAFRRFGRRLAEHEDRENRLLLRAATRDVGAAD